MPGVNNSSIKVARPQYDTRTASNANLALSTDTTMLKVARIMRSTSTQSIAHGMGYVPLVMFLRELSSDPKQVGHALSAPGAGFGNCSVDATNVNFEKIQAGDSAIIAVIFADPFGNEDIKRPSTPERPVLRTIDNRFDSRYDHLKVHSSGELTLNVPEWTSSAGDATDTVTATYTHNLGYVPLFAPFVPAQMSLEFYYQWHWQWHGRGVWATSRDYVPDDLASNSISAAYVCIKHHISSASTEPGFGANWTEYWVADATVFPDPWSSFPDRDIDINELDDVKVVYGGAFAFTDESFYLYATTTQLVLKYVRTDTQAFGYSTFPARTVNLSYTVFYNRVDEEFNLLT